MWSDSIVCKLVWDYCMCVCGKVWYVKLLYVKVVCMLLYVKFVSVFLCYVKVCVCMWLYVKVVCVWESMVCEIIVC